MRNRHAAGRCMVVMGVVLSIVVLVQPVSARQLLIKVTGGENAWTDSRLGDRLLVRFSRVGGLRCTLADGLSSELPPFPQALLDSDSLLDWGREVGGRFLLVVDVSDERLETRKTFSLPLVFHRYESFGVIEGELRLLDVQNSRVLLAEPIAFEQRARRQFQGSPDDNINDPDLHLTATEKVIFFSRLEDKLAQDIFDKVTEFTGRR